MIRALLAIAIIILLALLTVGACSPTATRAAVSGSSLPGARKVFVVATPTAIPPGVTPVFVTPAPGSADSESGVLLPESGGEHPQPDVYAAQPGPAEY